MTSPQRRRAQNELVFQHHNQELKRLAKTVLLAMAPELPLKFTCECSNEDCHDTIEIPVGEYEMVSRRDRQFIVVPGHEQPDIEKVVKHNGYNVVEKFEVPAPPADGQLNRT